MTESVGQQMYRLIERLFPICRSITGQGVRETLQLVGRHIPLAVHDVPTGTAVFDWTVPNEWAIRDAWVANSRGERLIDFQKCNLHVLNYSAPVKARLSLDELKSHLFTLPDHPDWIPYRTSYYAERWGFCLSHRQLIALPQDHYEVCIDSTLSPGSLTYGECYLPGQSQDEVLLSCHVCHPSLANDNLSGIALATFTAQVVASWPDRRYSYRFLFIPGTIGSITWLALNQAHAARIKHGLVLSCVGDAGHITYKKSRRGHAEVDRAVAHVLQQSGDKFEILEFVPYGYDERQYCSPGFNLPIGCFMRTPNGRYPEYHTSADNLDFIKPEALADSHSKLLGILSVLECNRRFLNQNPKCEPRLGKYGLYSSVGGDAGKKDWEMGLLWVLNFSDGAHSLLDIAERSKISFGTLKGAADALQKCGLLKTIPGNDDTLPCQ